MIPKIWFILLFFIVHIHAQRIDFSDNDSFRDVDYCSFYPALLLKHEINSFYKLPKNPVFTVSPSGWDSEDVADPFVHVTADSIYLFYDGSSNNHYSIGYAVRDKDGWNWINRKQILVPDKVKWRSYHIIAPTIIPGKQLLLYNGNERDIETGYKIGLAKKSAKWAFLSSKSIANPRSSSWDYSGNTYQDVVYIPDQKIYRMWYSGFTGPFAHIGLMESKNGIRWKKIGRKPVFQSSPGATSPEVIYNGEIYSLYFTQLDLNRGFATKIVSVKSTDGINWKDPRVVLIADERWEGHRLMRPNISFFEGQIHMYYCAQRGSKWNIGDATADVDFKNSGIWTSREIKKKPKKIVIKYEQPWQTEIAVSLVKKGQEQPVQLNLPGNSKEIRANVFHSVSDIDILPPFKIEIHLSTENESTSPTVYEVLLEN